MIKEYVRTKQSKHYLYKFLEKNDQKIKAKKYTTVVIFPVKINSESIFISSYNLGQK